MNPEDIDTGDVAGFSVELITPGQDSLEDGFNEYGVRENYDGEDLESIDVIFNAMEPGIRKHIEVTPEFLERIATKDNEGLPVQYDHSHSQRANVGNLTATKFNGSLKLMLNIPNTGSQIRSDTIADFTHSTGPQIQDGSVGFDPESLEFGEPEDDDAMARFVDGEMIEFSLTPFPAGYENGGVTASFSDAVDNFVESNSDQQEAESQLTIHESQLR